LVEIIENPEHPWFVGVQFHPEFRTTVETPHPLFSSFVAACLKREAERNEDTSENGIASTMSPISAAEES